MLISSPLTLGFFVKVIGSLYPTYEQSRWLMCQCADKGVTHDRRPQNPHD